MLLSIEPDGPVEAIARGLRVRRAVHPAAGVGCVVYATKAR